MFYNKIAGVHPIFLPTYFSYLFSEGKTLKIRIFQYLNLDTHDTQMEAGRPSITYTINGCGGLRYLSTKFHKDPTKPSMKLKIMCAAQWGSDRWSELKQKLLFNNLPSSGLAPRTAYGKNCLTSI